MDEYIKRDAALESLCTGCEYVPIEEKEVCPYRFTGCQEYANIFALPAADVVARDCYDRLLAENDELRKERPVVRCGECKHSAVDYENRRYCKLVTYYNHVPDDWFCADGKRKDGDGE